MRKSKGRDKVRPFTSIIMVVPSREDLSYLPPLLPPHTVLVATLHEVPLVTDIMVPLSPKGSPKHWVMERLVLVDKEDDTEEGKGEVVRALKNKMR